MPFRDPSLDLYHTVGVVSPSIVGVCKCFIFRCKISETVPLNKVPEWLNKLEDTRVGKAVMVNGR